MSAMERVKAHHALQDTAAAVSASNAALMRTAQEQEKPVQTDIAQPAALNLRRAEGLT